MLEWTSTGLQIAIVLLLFAVLSFAMGRGNGCDAAF